nr:unnamed protein product [Callosobruchus analis]CAI5847970.1 unnamed protein product [Callosobruchus analis]CAI5848153.1 unnamed protein product [Callosobruchus analis]
MSTVPKVGTRNG